MYAPAGIATQEHTGHPAEMSWMRCSRQAEARSQPQASIQPLQPMPNAPPDPLPWDFSKAPAHVAQSDVAAHRPSHGSDPPRATSFLVSAPLTYVQLVSLSQAPAPQQWLRDPSPPLFCRHPASSSHHENPAALSARSVMLPVPCRRERSCRHCWKGMRPHRRATTQALTRLCRRLVASLSPPWILAVVSPWLHRTVKVCTFSN